MTIRPSRYLIVDNDDPVTRSSGAAAMARGYRVDCATSLAAVNAPSPAAQLTWRSSISRWAVTQASM